MSSSLSVLWTVTTLESPRPWLHCAACAVSRPFGFSGKARLNANGRRLDGWLIYRCCQCQATWNRPVIERRRVSDVAPALLTALQSNDPAALLALAHDRAGLARFAHRIDAAQGLRLDKRILARDGPAPPTLSLRLVPAMPALIRADRILALGLGLSRARLAGMARDGRLRADGNPGRAVCAPMTLCLDIGDLDDAEAIRQRAVSP